MQKLFFLLICMFSISCVNKKVGIADFTWLEGKWTGSSEGMEFFEEWKPLQGNLMEGRGGAIEVDSVVDTVFSEKLKIRKNEKCKLRF